MNQSKKLWNVEDPNKVGDGPNKPGIFAPHPWTTRDDTWSVPAGLSREYNIIGTGYFLHEYYFLKSQPFKKSYYVKSFLVNLEVDIVAIVRIQIVNSMLQMELTVGILKDKEITGDIISNTLNSADWFLTLCTIQLPQTFFF